MKKKILIIVLLILMGVRVQALTYYWDATLGDDLRTPTQAQSQSTPWKSLTKLNSYFSSLQPGDSALFKRGQTFYGSVNVSRSGTSGARITIGAYGATGDDPLFTTLVPVTSWSGLGGNIWESVSAVSTLSTLKVCVDDGVLLHVARYPNAAYLTVDTYSGGTSISDNGFNSSSFTDLNDGYLVLRTSDWTLDNAPITSHSVYQTTGTTIVYGSGMSYPGGDGGGKWKAGWGYFVQDFAKALDVVGEFYYNPTTKKLRVYSVGTPTNVQISNIDNLVTGASRSYITFDNINFQGANSNLISMTGTGITFQNCEFAYAGINGVSIDGSNTVVEACYMHDILNGGVSAGGASASVRNCQIINTAHIQGMHANRAGLAALTISGSASIAEYNVIRNTGYIGIRCGRTNANTKNNVIDNFCMNRTDGGAIYVQGEDAARNTGPVYTNCRITGNIIMNGSTASTAGTERTIASTYGIYGDDRMSGLVITGNTVFNVPRAGYFFHGNKNITLTGNTGFDCAESQFFTSPSSKGWDVSGYVVNNNIFIARTSSQKVIYFNINSSETISGMGTINNNYYSRPVLETVAGGWGAAGNIIQTSVSFSNYLYYNLDRWNSTFVHDANTQNFGITITDPNKLSIIWNETKVPETKTLPNIYKDVTSASYSVSTVLQPFTSLVLLQTGIGTGKITPTITWANPATVTYGTLLSSTQLNATSGGVAGTFAYTPASGTLLNAGTQTLSVTFSPTDQITYNSVTKTATLVVNKAAATLTLSGLAKTYNGLPQPVTVTTNPTGLTGVSTTYNGLGMVPSNSGSYAVSSGLSNINYIASSVSGTLVISKAAATFNISNLAQVYNGSPKPITVTTNPTGLTGVSVTYNLSSTPPTAAGSYPIAVTLTHINYSATTVNTTLVISKATPTVSWSNPAAITYGIALSGTQLNATASVAGVFAYSPVSGTVLNASATPQTLSVNFTPTDASNYNSVNGTTRTITVNKAAATINLSGLSQVADGTPKSVVVSTTPIGLGILTVTYNGSTSPPSAPGTYPIIVSLVNSNYTATNATGNLVISTSVASVTITNLFQTYDGSPKPVTVTVTGGWPYDITYSDVPAPPAPTNAASYTVVATINDGIHFGSATETLVIAEADPVITWPSPSAISFGTALSGTQLNASTSVSGSFAYLPISGTLLNVGDQNLSVTFTPTDATNYNVITKIVPITVNKAAATLVVSNLIQTYDGSVKPITVTSNPATLSGIVITYNGSTVVPSVAGTYAIVVSLVNDNYQATNENGILIIGKGTPVLTWVQPERIFYGTPLSSVQLNATANMSGSFSYPLNPVGTILNVGTQSISVTFTPTDSANYNTVTISVPISVYGNNLDSLIGNWIFLNL